MIESVWHPNVDCEDRITGKIYRNGDIFLEKIPINMLEAIPERDLRLTCKVELLQQKTVAGNVNAYNMKYPIYRGVLKPSDRPYIALKLNLLDREMNVLDTVVEIYYKDENLFLFISGIMSKYYFDKNSDRYLKSYSLKVLMWSQLPAPQRIGLDL